MSIEHHVICDGDGCEARIISDDRQRLGAIVRQEGWRVEASGYVLCLDCVASQEADFGQEANSEFDQRGCDE